MALVAGALQSQRDALAHRALLTREQSSIENDVGIQVTHLLVALPSNWWKTKQNHRNTLEICYFDTEFGLSLPKVSIYSLKNTGTNFVQIVLWLSGHKYGEKLSFWKRKTPLDCSALDAKVTMVMSCFLRDLSHLFEYALTAEILYTVP